MNLKTCVVLMAAENLQVSPHRPSGVTVRSTWGVHRSTSEDLFECNEGSFRVFSSLAQVLLGFLHQNNLEKFSSSAETWGWLTSRVFLRLNYVIRRKVIPIRPSNMFCVSVNSAADGAVISLSACAEGSSWTPKSGWKSRSNQVFSFKPQRNIYGLTQLQLSV